MLLFWCHGAPVKLPLSTIPFLLLGPAAFAGSAMTWNLEWFPVKSSKYTMETGARISAAQAVLAANPADVLLFQEVNNWQAA